MRTITKTFEFAAAHRLYRPDWSEEQNWRVYGNCANANGHGHNYLLEVTVAGEIDPETGMLVNFRDLQTLVDELVLSEVDHKNLNSDVPWLAGKIPTAEVIVDGIWERLEQPIEKAFVGLVLERLDLWENSSCKASRMRTT